MNIKKSLLYVFIIAMYFVVSSYTHCVYAYDTDSQIIGISNNDLLGGEIDGISICRVRESNLGNLIADSMVSHTTELLKETKYKCLPIVGIQNGGGIRDTIHAGNITRMDIDNILPYKNNLVLYNITPKTLYDVLENGVSMIYQDYFGVSVGLDGRFPQISGMSFIYDRSQNPNNRIVAIYLNGMNTKLDKNDENQHIILAFNSYCIDGRDGYTMLSSDDIIYNGKSINDIVCDYIIKISNNNQNIIDYKIENRIESGYALGRENKNITMVLNSEILECDDALPFIEEHKLFIPLRKTFESINAEVIWDETAESVNVKKQNIDIIIKYNQNYFELNGDIFYTNTFCKIQNDRIMMPIDWVEKLLNTNIYWDGTNNTVYLNN